MSNNIEWADARQREQLHITEEVCDPFGNMLDPGKVGLAFGGVVIEGTVHELRQWLEVATRVLRDYFDTNNEEEA